LDLGFLPKELLYSDNNYQSSNKNLLAAIEILEKAQNQEKKVVVEERKDGLWSKIGNIFNPFKCGKEN
jgi:hypothetical protein